jgi:HEPN domain-containing protein
VKKKGEAPRSHLLVGLASMIDREIPDNLMLLINELNDVSVLARYPDDIEELRASLTALEIEAYLGKTKELFEWLQQDKRLRQ